MGFQQGLSGLSAASKQLDVIGNNVANASTIGFKGSRTEFADMYAATLYGVAATTSGIGTQVTAVAQQFTQGNINTTNNPLDLAIGGNGFFRVQNGNDVAYTRNGQFQLDRSGYIVNNGWQLTGYPADQNGNILQGNPAPLQINAANMGAKETKNMTLAVNLDASQTTPATTPFNVTDPTSYNSSRSVTVYDSLGVSHPVTYYFVKDPAPATNSWTVNAVFDKEATVQNLGKLTFNTDGSLNTAALANVVSTSLAANGANEVNIALDMTKSTQFSGPFSVNTLVADGYADGTLTSLATSADGTIQARFSNGQVKTVGQVILTGFANVQGLKPTGGNRWVESYESGKPKDNLPGSSNVGTIQSSALEDSNIDLTAELVNMITAQRYYQANAQAIKTEDQIMQTMINLR